MASRPAAEICAWICHQDPQRSLALAPDHAPCLCARCLGIYAGFAVTALALRFQRERPPRWALFMATAALIATAAEVAAEWWSDFGGSNLLRGGLGLAAGAGFACWFRAGGYGPRGTARWWPAAAWATAALIVATITAALGHPAPVALSDALAVVLAAVFYAAALVVLVDGLRHRPLA